MLVPSLLSVSKRHLSECRLTELIECMLTDLRALMKRMQHMLRVAQPSFQLFIPHLPQTPPPLLPVSKSHKHWSMCLNRKAQKKDNSWESENLCRQNRTEKFTRKKNYSLTVKNGFNGMKDWEGYSESWKQPLYSMYLKYASDQLYF